MPAHSSDTASPNNVDQRNSTLIDAYWSNLLVGSHSCALCGRHMPSREELQRHLLVHMIGASFPESTVASTTVPPARPYVCFRCDAAFTTAAGLTQHAVTHNL